MAIPPIPKSQFAHYTIRRLDAEVLLDALCWIGGEGRGYTSATPEPYTFIPKENRAIALADGSITSSFLATFGRSARDTGLIVRARQPIDGYPAPIPLEFVGHAALDFAQPQAA